MICSKISVRLVAFLPLPQLPTYEMSLEYLVNPRVPSHQGPHRNYIPATLVAFSGQGCMQPAFVK